MDWAEFYQWVRESLNRGNVLDSVIPHYVRACVKEIENKANFAQMQWWGTFTIESGDEPIIALPSRLKAIEFVRYKNTQDKFEYPKRYTTKENIVRNGEPERYWQQGRQFITFDATPTRDIEFEILAYRYSQVPEEEHAEGNHNWLLDAIPNGLHAKVMYAMSPYIREDDPQVFRMWAQNAQEAIVDLLRENVAVEDDNTVAEMEFWPDHIPYSKAFSDAE